MGKNKKYFEDGEANKWFRRNLKDLELKQNEGANALKEVKRL